jgi:hypothetical protein
MERLNILAVTQSELQFICQLRNELARGGFDSLNIARNSDEAILYLRGVGIYSNRGTYPAPDALILDCGNVDASDLEVLSWVRSQADFSELPIILLCPELNHPGTLALPDHYCSLASRSALHEVPSALEQCRKWHAQPAY